MVEVDNAVVEPVSGHACRRAVDRHGVGTRFTVMTEFLGHRFLPVDPRSRLTTRMPAPGYVTFGNDISFEDFVRLPMAAMKTLFRSLDDAAQ